MGTRRDDRYGAGRQADRQSGRNTLKSGSESTSGKPRYDSFRYDGGRNGSRSAGKEFGTWNRTSGGKESSTGRGRNETGSDRRTDRQRGENRPVNRGHDEYRQTGRARDEYRSENRAHDEFRTANHGGYRTAGQMNREDEAFRVNLSAEQGYGVSPETAEESYILTGRNPIREALKTGRDLEKLLVQKGELSGSAMEIVKTAKERKIMVQVVEKSRLDEITPRHQGLIAFASAFRYSTVEDMLENAAVRGEDPFLILLDGITDPHNLGAIIRSAECTGAHGIIVPQHRSVGLTPAAVKASAGAVEYIPIARVTNLNRTIEELQKKNIWVYALTMNGTDYEEVSFTGGTAVVIGAEGDGISKLTEEKCDVSVSLPMKGHLDSLNASVAAGVIMYRIMSSRKKG